MRDIQNIQKHINGFIVNTNIYSVYFDSPLQLSLSVDKVIDNNY